MKRQTRTVGLKFEKSDIDWFQEWCENEKTTATATIARFISACRAGKFNSPFLVDLDKYKELEERLERLEELNHKE